MVYLNLNLFIKFNFYHSNRSYREINVLQGWQDHIDTSLSVIPFLICLFSFYVSLRIPSNTHYYRNDDCTVYPLLVVIEILLLLLAMPGLCLRLSLQFHAVILWCSLEDAQNQNIYIQLRHYSASAWPDKSANIVTVLVMATKWNTLILFHWHNDLIAFN